MSDDDTSAPDRDRGRWRETIGWSAAAMALGTGMGLVSGFAWLREASRAHDVCAIERAANPESPCVLGYGLFGRPIVVLVAAAAAALLVWLLLTIGILRPRAGIVATVPVLLVASGFAFDSLGSRDALDDPASWRMWVPAVALGVGLPAMSMIARLHRDRWNWRARLMPAPSADRP